MDRRQRKTREAIFNAFTALLSQKNFHQITVGEIIDKADVGRATFYSHFETKEYLLKEYCKELFCHIFDTEGNCNKEHRHIFRCDGSDSVFLHLFQHLKRNDNHILELLSTQRNELFLSYFRSNLEILIESHLDLFETKRSQNLPESFWINHLTATLLETIRWWILNGKKESPELITEYYLSIV